MNWNSSNKLYPVYFFSSDTSGEKQFEEFYGSADEIDLQQFKALGVIKNSIIPSKNKVLALINSFKELFESREVDKSKIINLLNEFLPDFNHIETGKNLDQKM